MARKRGGEHRPEYRLVLTTIGGFILPLGMLIFGASPSCPRSRPSRLDGQRERASGRSADRAWDCGLREHVGVRIGSDVHRCDLAGCAALIAQSMPRSRTPQQLSPRHPSCGTCSVLRFPWPRRPCGRRLAGDGAGPYSPAPRCPSCPCRSSCSSTARRCVVAGRSSLETPLPVDSSQSNNVHGRLNQEAKGSDFTTTVPPS